MTNSAKPVHNQKQEWKVGHKPEMGHVNVSEKFMVMNAFEGTTTEEI